MHSLSNRYQALRFDYIIVTDRTKMLRLLLLVTISLQQFGCTFMRLDVASRRCFVPDDAVGCDCIAHVEGETHVSCVDAGIGEIPSRFKNPTTLELRGNEVEVVAKIDYPSLKQLRLTRNGIHQVNDRAFHKLGNLTILSLAHNLIKVLTSNTFVGLQNLELLNLEDNLINEIKSDVFVGLSHLQFLKLSMCRIHMIEPGSFAGLHRLFQLNISHNHINSLPVLGNKSGLPNLSDLDLSDNRIRFMFGPSLRHLTSLTHLFLSRNRLSRLFDISFPPTVKATLKSLWLRQNHLSRIDPGTFSQLRTLSTLDISFNLLRELDPTELPESVVKFLVHDNPWNCSCGKNLWLIKKPFVREWNSETEVTCAWPEHMRGLNAFDREAISKLDSDCDQSSIGFLESRSDVTHVKLMVPTNKAFWIGLGALVASAICLSAVIIILRGRRKPKRNPIYRGYLRRSEESTKSLIASS